MTALLFTLALAAGADFELAGPDCVATIVVPPGEAACVRLAAEDLAGDVEKISGQRPTLVTRWEGAGAGAVVLATVGRPDSDALIDRLLPGAKAQLADRWECYRVASVAPESEPNRRALVIAGSDERATMFGLYAFCETYLGVDPLYFWTDRPPAPRARLAWDQVTLTADEPTFRYRGWFINDEDLLTEWHLDGGRRDIDYPYYARVTSPRATGPLFEAMLRLGFNLVIPASFVDLRNPDEARLIDDATRRGLLVTMHHVEPLGMSGFGFQNYWRDRGESVPFSFIQHPDKFEEIWLDYARRWARYGPRVVWQLGLRGIADRPVWASDPRAPKTDAARGKLISDAMALQWEIVRRVDSRPRPPATTTLWMEGAQLHAAGHLEFPPGVAVIFADNSPGWELQRDFYEVARQPDRPYGIYYHHALWGSGPHLAQAVSPQRAHAIFGLAVARQSTDYAMLNVANVREFVLGVDASARFLRDFDAFDPDRYLAGWCQAHFGPAAEQAEQAYRLYFDSFETDGGAGRAQLDGEIVHAGTRFLGVLLERLAADRLPLLDDPDRVRARRKEIGLQRARLALAGAQIDAVLARTRDGDRQFFETNFVAQYQIMHGLAGWQEECLAAGLALDEGDPVASRARVTAALAGLAEVRAGQALASRGRWENWYRGDRKMNLAGAEALTQRLAASDNERP